MEVSVEKQIEIQNLFIFICQLKQQSGAFCPTQRALCSWQSWLQTTKNWSVSMRNTLARRGVGSNTCSYVADLHLSWVSVFVSSPSLITSPSGLHHARSNMGENNILSHLIFLTFSRIVVNLPVLLSYTEVDSSILYRGKALCQLLVLVEWRTIAEASGLINNLGMDTSDILK